jgi:hypothetical protein
MTECTIQQNLCPIYRGDTIPFDFTFTQPDDTPLDISNMTLTFTMKEDPTDTDVVLQESVVFPHNTESTNGKGSLTVPSTSTDTLEPDMSYYYDFQLVNVDEVFTIGAGKIKVLYDITR